MPKKVGIVYMLSHPGGVQACVLALIRGLNSKGIVPDMLWDTPPKESLLKDGNAQANYVRVPFRIPQSAIVRLPDTLRYLAWIPNIVDGKSLEDRYDCIFSFYNGFLIPNEMPHVYYLSGPPLLPQLDSPSPGLRGLPFRTLRTLYRTLFRRVWPAYEYHRNRNYVINSRYTADLFQEAHGVNLPVVYPPIELANRSFEPGDLPKRDTILFFSRIVGYKRPEMVLELAQKHPSYRFVIMGGVPPNRRAYFEALGAKAKASNCDVCFLDNPSNQRVREELARARFYVFPAMNEHFGMTTPEAIASGAVPFVHDSGGQREIVVDERLRFSDPTFHSKFEALASMPEEELQSIRERLGKHVKTFSEEAFISKMLAYMNSN